ncbi:MAG: response regulator [Bacteroidia bacterium]
MDKKLSILLADDHQIMLDGLQSLLSSDANLKIVAQANTGKEALTMSAQLQPDLILMDLNMPEMNGMVAAQKVKSTQPGIKVIILSLHAEKTVIQQMIDTGIDGYLIKTANKEELLRAIHHVAGGGKYFSSDVAMSLSGMNTTVSSIAHVPHDMQQQLALLSAREVEVLTLIAEGFSNKEIGENLFLSARTIDAHRANIMKKLAINKVTGLVRFAVKAGLVE